MEKYHRVFRGVVALFLAVGMLLMFVGPAFAENTNVNQVVKDDRKGIVQVRLVYTMDNGTKIPIQSGTGFLIGTDNTSTTVITNNHVIKLSNENAEVMRNVFSGFDVSKVTTDVVVKGDVTIGAEKKQGSDEVDFAIMELSQPIGGKEPLKLAADSELDDIATQPVYALGFPDVTKYVEDFPKYTSEQVNITSGTVGQQSNYQGRKILQHNCDLSYGNSGGPLVNSNGVVLGINTAMLTNDFGSGSGYNVAVDIREVSIILDMLNIAYEKAGTTSPANTTKQPGTVDKKALKEVIASAESTDTSKYSEASVSALKGTLNDAKAIADKGDATQEAVDQATKDLKGAVGKLEQKSEPNWLLIGGILAGVLVIVVIIISIIVNKNKRKKKAKSSNETINGNGEDASGAGSIGLVSGIGSDDTSLLDEGSGQTTVMTDQPMSYAVLQRKSSSESIQITKPVFKIGKERKKVDYCIADNSSVSRIHAIIEYRVGEFYLKDNHATNGTFINEGRISAGQEVQLKNGDSIKLSNVEFEFKG